MLRILPAAFLFNSYPWLLNDCQHVVSVSRARGEMPLTLCVILQMLIMISQSSLK
jgi:hypothetical protein